MELRTDVSRSKTLAIVAVLQPIRRHTRAREKPGHGKGLQRSDFSGWRRRSTIDLVNENVASSL